MRFIRKVEQIKLCGCDMGRGEREKVREEGEGDREGGRESEEGRKREGENFIEVMGIAKGIE